MREEIMSWDLERAQAPQKAQGWELEGREGGKGRRNGEKEGESV
jgi:hypothetical protein